MLWLSTRRIFKRWLYQASKAFIKRILQQFIAIDSIPRLWLLKRPILKKGQYSFVCIRPIYLLNKVTYTKYLAKYVTYFMCLFLFPLLNRVTYQHFIGGDWSQSEEKLTNLYFSEVAWNSFFHSTNINWALVC